MTAPGSNNAPFFCNAQNASNDNNNGFLLQHMSLSRARQQVLQAEAAAAAASGLSSSPAPPERAGSMVSLRGYHPSPMQQGGISLGDLASQAYYRSGLCSRSFGEQEEVLAPQDPTMVRQQTLTVDELHNTIQRVLDLVADDDF